MASPTAYSQRILYISIGKFGNSVLNYLIVNFPDLVGPYIRLGTQIGDLSGPDHHSKMLMRGSVLTARPDGNRALVADRYRVYRSSFQTSIERLSEFLPEFAVILVDSYGDSGVVMKEGDDFLLLTDLDRIGIDRKWVILLTPTLRGDVTRSEAESLVGAVTDLRDYHSLKSSLTLTYVSEDFAGISYMEAAHTLAFFLIGFQSDPMKLLQIFDREPDSMPYPDSTFISGHAPLVEAHITDLLGSLLGSMRFSLDVPRALDDCSLRMLFTLFGPPELLMDNVLEGMRTTSSFKEMLIEEISKRLGADTGRIYLSAENYMEDERIRLIGILRGVGMNLEEIQG